MSISRSDWEKTFQQIRERLAHTVPPVRYPVQTAKIIGVKAGLSLVSLSPEPVAGKIAFGQECYNSSGTKITGDFYPQLIDFESCATDVNGIEISSTTYMKLYGLKCEKKLSTVTIVFDWKVNGGTGYCRIKEDASIEVAEFTTVSGSYVSTGNKTFTPGSATSEIAIEVHNSAGFNLFVRNLHITQ